MEKEDTKKTNDNIVDLSLHITIITFSASGLNTSMKRDQ